MHLVKVIERFVTLLNMVITPELPLEVWKLLSGAIDGENSDIALDKMSERFEQVTLRVEEFVRHYIA